MTVGCVIKTVPLRSNVSHAVSEETASAKMEIDVLKIFSITMDSSPAQMPNGEFERLNRFAIHYGVHMRSKLQVRKLSDYSPSSILIRSS